MALRLALKGPMFLKLHPLEVLLEGSMLVRIIFSIFLVSYWHLYLSLPSSNPAKAFHFPASSLQP
jgi:hypothetical protein